MIPNIECQNCKKEVRNEWLHCPWCGQGLKENPAKIWVNNTSTQTKSGAEYIDDIKSA